MLPIQMANCLSALDTPKIVMNVYGYLRMLVCIIHNLYCIPIYLLLTLVLMPTYYISLALYANIENNLYNWLLYIVSSWSYGCGMIINEHGDDIYSLVNDPNVRLLIISNHQSTADVPLIMQSFTSRSRWVLLWVMDAVFKWTNFGMVSQMHGDYFLNTRQYVSGTMFKHCTTKYSMLKNAIILFPEGGFRYKRQASSNSFAMKRNLPLLTNVTYPRYHGYHELMEPAVGVTHVVDLTICYDDIEALPSVVDLVCGRRVSSINFHFQVFPVCDTANITSEEWLFERWQFKDRALAGHYTAMRKLLMTTSTTNHHNYHNELSSKKDDVNNSLQRSPASTSSSSSSSSSSVTYSSMNNKTRKLNGTKKYHSLQQPQQQQVQHRNNLLLILDNNTTTDGSSSNLDSNATTNADPESLVTNRNVASTTQSDHQQLTPNSQQQQFNNLNNNNNNNDDQHHNQMSSNSSSSSNLVQLFDPSQGRPVEMSWFKILAIHSFFLSINFIIYLLFILII